MLPLLLLLLLLPLLLFVSRCVASLSWQGYVSSVVESWSWNGKCHKNRKKQKAGKSMPGHASSLKIIARHATLNQLDSGKGRRPGHRNGRGVKVGSRVRIPSLFGENVSVAACRRFVEASHQFYKWKYLFLIRPFLCRKRKTIFWGDPPLGKKVSNLFLINK
jgi:hypothetical protein